MEMIAHRHDRAISKLELAVARNSSAACATLANLYSKGYCRQDQPTPSSSVSPPSVSSPPSTSYRPRMPLRSTSWNCHTQHQGHRSQESVQAAGLYLRGLEIELEKPVQSAGKRGRRVGEESSSEDERTEGKHWMLQSALDLIVGLTDAHRFGVLQPPASSFPSSPKLASSTSNDDRDSLWTRSSRASSRVLSHPTIAPLLSSLSSDSHLPTSASPARPAATPTLSRSMSASSSRRTQSVSRSYTHPAASIPEPGSIQNRKLETTIAIHALYILALQAFSSSSNSDLPVSDLPTPDASPILIDESSISSSPTSSSTKPIPGGGGIESQSGKELSGTLFDQILLLANSLNGTGLIGIKEGDELVSRAQRRLDAIRNIERPGEEDWRLAKKKKRVQQQRQESMNEERMGLSIPEEASTGNGKGGHEKERSDQTTSSSMTVTPGSYIRRNSKFHFADDQAENEDEGRGGPTSKDPYPSPPDTPPPTEHLSTKQLPLLDTASASVQASSSASPQSGSLRSPPLGSPLQPRYRSLHSQSTTHLSAQRQRRDSLSSFQSNTPSSILSRFKSDPSKQLLRRVESSTSVCTVPPDFGATRLKAGDKGKGKAIDPERLGLGGFSFGRGEMASRQSGGLGTVEIDRKVGKSWLSRFFSVSGLNPVRESGGARDRLREALQRDEEASTSIEYVMDWGDEDFPTEDEEEENERLERDLESDQASSSPPTTLEDSEPRPEKKASSIRTSPDLAAHSQIRDKARPEATPRPSLPRRQSSKQSLHSKRSFMLNDPTSAAGSSESHLSPNPHSSPRNRHRRHPSSSSSNFLSPLSAATPPGSSSRSKKPKAASIDPLLLELERSSRVGVRTVCQSCHKKGLNYPACRSCGKCYCSRTCRVGVNHECVQSEAISGKSVRV
ncbi:hypothetical protein JCM16303_001426 [Sporobolomyces ruberrimus]